MTPSSNFCFPEGHSEGCDHAAAMDPGLPEFISSASLGNDLFRSFYSSFTPLGNFCKQALFLHMMTSTQCSSKQLWPCQVPPSLARPRGPLRSRRRSRYQLRVHVREHLRLFVASCNWLVCGKPKKLTTSWPPHSSSQSRMLNDLEGSIRLFYRLASGYSSGLDRALGKYNNLHDSLFHLAEATEHLRHELDSYSRASRPCSADAATVDASDESVASHSGSPEAVLDQPPVLLRSQHDSTALSLDPDRIQFKSVPSFKAESFICDPLLKAGFMNPVHLRTPQQHWPSTKRARVMCDRENLLKLFKKWDAHHCLALIPAANSELRYRCGLFAVYKSQEKDRQNLNPIPENGRSMVMNASTLTLAHGSLLTGVYLAYDEDLVVGADDLEDFYHNFVVSPLHAQRNHIHGVFPGDIFEGWHAWDPKLKGKEVVGCFRTLAMGTSFAVEVAQHAHSNLLRRAGVLSPDLQVAYRKPLPRGPTLLLLCIDDLGILQKIPRGMPPDSKECYRGDLLLLEKAGAAYERAGLRTSSKKAVRNQSCATVLGGEIDGRRGTLNAPRLRILALSKLTLKLVTLGWATKHLLETIIGSWIFVLLFRRPLLSLFNDVFHEGECCKNRHEVFQLSTGAKQELLLVSLWSPFAGTNLRAVPLDRIYCSDASLAGGGVCVAPFTERGTLELSRVAEQKGFYTRVDSSTLGQYTARLEGGIVDDDENKCLGPPRSMQEGFLWDFCEVFRGTGNLSNSHKAVGLSVHPGFEIADGPQGDVLEPSTALAIVGLIARRVVRVWHIAPVCTTFGTLRRPRLRSKLIPFGFDPDQDDTHLGNKFAMRGGFILFLCLYYDLLVSGEQPGGSVMFRLDIFVRLQQAGFFSIRFPFCNWGTPFQKMSWWLANNPLLKELSDQCHCGAAGAHFRVRGTFDHQRLAQFKRLCRPSAKNVFGRDPLSGEPVAKFSAGYPIPLCDYVANLNCRQLGSEDRVREPSYLRPFSSPPNWIGQLGRSLPWKKVIQFSFKQSNHINVNEQLSYRSLLKHVSKTTPHSRFCALLDSRVVIGCNAKGRSSSKQLNFYLSSALPYIVGGDLYPFLLHIGSSDNFSDDISRFVALRKPSEPLPPWLRLLLQGQHQLFDQVVAADKFVWPWNGWARLIRLAILASCNQ